MDGVHVVGQRRGHHAGVDRREAAAHVDHVGEHPRPHQGAGGLGHGRLVGGGPHALGAHVEGHAHQLLGRPPGGEQQRRRLVGGDAELSGQGVGRALRGDRQTDHEVEVAGPPRGLEDLLELLVGVEGEGPDPVVEVRPGDRAPALDRVHEGHARLRDGLSDELDLGQRGHVERAHAIVPQGLDGPRRGVRLDRVEDVAFEVVLEPACRYGHRVGSHKCDRTFRGPLTDQVQGHMVRVQFT